jgi:hypothetical protein
LSQNADFDKQLESRLIAKEEGVWIPQGGDGRYCSWLKHTSTPEDHAKVMTLLQRTQLMDVNTWRECREEAYRRFGHDVFQELLENRDQENPKYASRTTPRFITNSILFGALKEEESRLTPEWKSRLLKISRSVREGASQQEILNSLRTRTKQQQKIRLVRKDLAKD